MLHCCFKNLTLKLYTKINNFIHCVSGREWALYCTILSVGTTKNPKNLHSGNSGSSGVGGSKDLSSCYANNFKSEAEMASSTAVNLEALFINAMFKKLVSKMTGKMVWLKAADNASLYNDCRGLINHVKINYGSIFRRVALSGLMDSTKKLIKTQYKVDNTGHHLTRYIY